MLNGEHIFYAFQLSVVAWVFNYLLEPEMIFGWYGRIINRLPDWLFKPLGGCNICFGGQLAFWNSWWIVDNYLQVVLFTFVTMIMVIFLNLLEACLERNN